ncbi:MAG: DNA-binding response regulator [Cytophagia bacterium]|nr:DNA-binding response regulator [Cytophagia bacterium]
MKQHKILLVEDDANLGFVIKDNLSLKGYEVTLCSDGRQAMDNFKASLYQLCLLDVMLPKADGFAVARHIRTHDKEVPILFLSAKNMTEDKLSGFRTGADDYITKPFSFEELFYRIEVFLRRRKPLLDAEHIKVKLGEYLFDSEKLTLDCPQCSKTLTQREALILQLLCRHQNNTLKREEILNHVWGSDDYFMGRSLDVFISKLRKYLQHDPSVQIINHHGVGFSLRVNEKL